MADMMTLKQGYTKLVFQGYNFRFLPDAPQQEAQIVVTRNDRDMRPSDVEIIRGVVEPSQLDYTVSVILNYKHSCINIL